MKTEKFNSRSKVIDAIRGFTIILMIIFHTSFDLNNFGFLNFDILHHPFWYIFPRIIVFLFLFAVGASLTLAHKETINWSSFWKRFFKIAICALIVSLVTYFMFPENWIYFGTLHAIAIISLMSLPFLKMPKTSLFVAIALFFPSIFFDLNIPWLSLPHQSWDYISPFPWVGASLLGIFATHKNIHKIDLPDNSLVRSLNFLGKHSLVIYLIHQPLIFGCLFLIKKF